jgi:hypothetical protein
MVACIIPASFGLNPWVSLIFGFALLYLLLRIFGQLQTGR